MAGIYAEEQIMENPVNITYLNDFIFCPVSIYFHNLDYETDVKTYQSEYQINGTAAHEKCDEGQYSTKKSILQGMMVYSDKYNLIGKIDIFDSNSGVLTERKRTIKTIYDGYIYQLYAQYYALTEMGYQVNELRMYSMTDNRVYQINKPEEDIIMKEKFEQTILKLKNFSFSGFVQKNGEKCEMCIYEPLCSFSQLKG